ncbi:MAG: ATP-binding cassette domain-containing protein [Candidatus Thorarchaeota archaeon]|nr:ATP-binding cassette domain-containing protein [Candidatus Thorarchaeota archaeon]
MITSLALQDFKLFKDQQFKFATGTTAIVGPNGSGKTTILEAIEFALFKQVTRKEKTIKQVEDLIRHGQKKAKVELTFKAPVNRREYKVERTIHPKKTGADLYLAGERDPFESGPNRVDSEIISLLGMDRNAFAALTYVRQGEIDLLSRLSPKDRRENLYDMMGLGVYGKKNARVQSELRQIKKEIGGISDSKDRLEEVRATLPSEEEIERSLQALELVKVHIEDQSILDPLKLLLEKVKSSRKAVQLRLTSPDFAERKEELESTTEIASRLRSLLASIPEIAEEQLRPHVREEARSIFLRIFGDRYSDFIIDDGYDVSLYDLRGNKVALQAASGGEDVCVNFSLRVAVNAALQKHSISGPPPGLIILDEPGAGLDAERRRWLPDAVAGLDIVDQVIVVTHMEELKEAANTVVSLIPQGKGRQPVVEISE